MHQVAVERQLFQRTVGFVQHGHAGRFVDTAALHADKTVLDDVDAFEGLKCDLLVLGGPEAEEAAPAGDLREPTHERVIDDASSVHEIERLEDHADVGSYGSQFGLGCTDDLTAVDEHRSGDRNETVDGPEHRRLPCSGETDDDDELTLFDAQRHVPESDEPSRVRDGRVGEFDETHESGNGRGPVE